MAAFLDDSLISADKPQTLCDWVKNFRLKKIQMKRKYRHGSNLRVCAMLTTALNNAEKELKLKQQERFNKWAEMQSRLGYYNYNNMNSTNNNINNIYYNYNNSSCAKEMQSYSYYNNQQNSNNINSSINCEDDILQQQHRDNINDLWKSELSGLDQFMKNMSSACSVIN
ncbi:myb-like protein M [Condylostylus longicornis]|uniref:myb-like protein M n=1 Tax=Condylostylus longicornis TaxID=2530218 RepID=UPI00244DDB57|nr:myb-like protein M [Condylostylus longicornis]